MRTSNDLYKTKDGKLISVDQMTKPPKDSILWKGYDYENQEWVFNGKKDNRKIEDLYKE